MSSALSRKIWCKYLYPVRSYWHFSFHIPKHPRWRRPPSWIFRLCEFGYSSVLILLYLCSTKFGSNICYSHRDRRTYASYIHLITSRELTSGLVISAYSRDASSHKICAYISIQSGVIDIFPKFKMAAAAILDFQVMWIWPFRHVDSVVFVFCAKFGSNICYCHWDRRTYTSDLHLMTSRELTSGFDFCSRGHLRMAVMHRPTKFGTDIFIQSGVIDTSPN